MKYGNMSRIGKQPIEIPAGVEVKMKDRQISVKGPKGELSREIPEQVSVELKDKEIRVSAEDKAFWGLFRTLIANMIQGVTEGHEKKLELRGVGYRANLEGEELVLIVGYSHPVKIKKPEGITFLVEKNIITVSGADKEIVGQTAAKIREVRKPEPYKGKGIRYVGEEVKIKVGKKAVGTE